MMVLHQKYRFSSIAPELKIRILQNSVRIEVAQMLHAPNLSEINLLSGSLF